MDYSVFSAEFEDEIRNIKLQTKYLGRSKYYKLYKLENFESDLKKVSIFRLSLLHVLLADPSLSSTNVFVA